MTIFTNQKGPPKSSAEVDDEIGRVEIICKQTEMEIQRLSGECTVSDRARERLLLERAVLDKNVDRDLEQADARIDTLRRMMAEKRDELAGSRRYLDELKRPLQEAEFAELVAEVEQCSAESKGVIRALVAGELALLQARRDARRHRAEARALKGRAARLSALLGKPEPVVRTDDLGLRGSYQMPAEDVSDRAIDDAIALRESILASGHREMAKAWATGSNDRTVVQKALVRSFPATEPRG